MCVSRVSSMPRYSFKEQMSFVKRLEKIEGNYDTLEGESWTSFDKKLSNLNDGSNQKDEIEKQNYEVLISALECASLNYNKLYYAVRVLSQTEYMNKHMDELVHKVDLKISSTIEETFTEFNHHQYADIGSDYPIVAFYEQIWNQFKYLSVIYDPILNRKRARHLKSLRTVQSDMGTETETEKEEGEVGEEAEDEEEEDDDDEEKEEECDEKLYMSNGYEISEIQCRICMQFIDYCYTQGDSLYYTESDKMRILNKSISKLCSSIKNFLLDSFTPRESDVEMEKMSEFFKFSYMIEKITGSECFRSTLSKSFLHACKNVISLLYKPDNYENIYTQLRAVYQQIEKLNFEFSKIDFLSKKNIFNKSNYDFLFANHDGYFLNALEYAFMDTYKNFNANTDTDKNKIVAIFKFYSDHGWSFNIWKPASIKFSDSILDKLGDPNEDKFKDMVKYLDGIIPVVERIKRISEGVRVDHELVDIFAEQFHIYWSKKFKRDFVGHFNFFIDFKLKTISKNNDRNKLEKELNKLIGLFKLIFPKLSNIQKLKFKKRYQSLFLQRMLNSLFTPNFTSYTNIIDCETDMAGAIDSHMAGTKKDIHELVEEINEAYEIYSKYCNVSNDNVSAMVGLPRNLEQSNDEMLSSNLSLRLPPELISETKEYSRWLKAELRKHKKLGNYIKVKFELSYAYSKLNIDYTLGNGQTIHIICNMYQGLILTLFDEYEDGDAISLDTFADKLNVPERMILKHISPLCLKRHALLVMKDDRHWFLNNNFTITEKLSDSSNTLVIK